MWPGENLITTRMKGYGETRTLLWLCMETLEFMMRYIHYFASKNKFTLFRYYPTNNGSQLNYSFHIAMRITV